MVDEHQKGDRRDLHLRDRFDNWFGHFADWVIRLRFWVFAAAVVIVPLLALGLPNVTMDTSNESFLQDDDPVLEQYRAFERSWGRNDRIIIGVQAEDVFAPEVIQQISDLEKELASEVPHVDEINSLINARHVHADGKTLYVDDLLEEPVPTDSGVLAESRDYALDDPALSNLFVNSEGTVTLISVELQTFTGSNPRNGNAAGGFQEDFAEVGADQERRRLTEAEVTEAVKTVQGIIADRESGPAELFVTGSPVAVQAIQEAMESHMGFFIAMSMLLAILALALLFRRPSAVVLPMLVVISGIIAIMGTHGHIGQPLTLPMTIAPSFLLAVGVASTVHLLTPFYRAMDERGAERADAVRTAMREAGVPMVLAALTTAGSLTAFIITDLAPIIQLGTYVPIGVLVLLVLSLTVLPAMLVIFPLRAKSSRHTSGSTLLDRQVSRVGVWASRNPVPVLGGAAVLVVVAAVGIASIPYGHNPLSWLPEDNAARSATERLDDALAGTIGLEVVIDTGEVEGVMDPGLLRDIDRLNRDLESNGAAGVPIGKAVGLPTAVKQTHKVLNQDRESAYSIPESRQLLAQELLLFESSGSDELEDLVDSQYREMRVSLRLPWRDALEYQKASEHVEARFSEVVGDRADVRVSGVLTLFTGAIQATMDATVVSYLVAALITTILMVLLVGNLGLGLVAMLPAMTPIAIVLGGMGYFGVTLNLFNLLVGTIALGLAVDDTIHFLHHFRHRIESGEATEQAISGALEVMGHPITVTSMVLAASFAVYAFGDLGNLVALGSLTAIAIVLALVCTVLMLPALVALLYRKYQPAGGVEEAAHQAGGEHSASTSG